jgi:hypothetical protein
MVKLKRNVIFGEIFRENTKKTKTFASTLKNTHRVHEECVFEWRLVLGIFWPWRYPLQDLSCLEFMT